MSGRQLVWRTNLRANLVLWPTVAPNIAALAQSAGTLYNESSLLEKLPIGFVSKVPNDSRAVRNTFEVMALSGLAYREGNPQVLQITDFGRTLFSFLLRADGEQIAFEENRRLAAEYTIRALSVILEYRTLWSLWRKCGNILTNEELNRAMARLAVPTDVDETSEAVLVARQKSDPTWIGPRKYEDDKFARAPDDQRKALNPVFLLASGGRLFSNSEDGRRVLEGWSCEMIDQALEQDLPEAAANTEPAVAKMMSDYSCSPGI